MKITLLPSAVGNAAEGSPGYLTSVLINDTVALDAGSLGFYRTPQEQTRIRHVLISHTHIDHVASLPIFLENAYENRADPVTIHGSEVVLQSLRSDLFNDRVWPDFIALSRPEAPFLKLARMESGRTLEVEGLRITPVPVDHVVPTVGFIVEDDTAAVVFSSDTGPTDEIWQRARELPHLKAVFLEATFPNELGWLANASKHLTPALFQAELAKLQRDVPVIAVHIKARFQAPVVRELQALRLPKLGIGRWDHVYSF